MFFFIKSCIQLDKGKDLIFKKKKNHILIKKKQQTLFSKRGYVPLHRTVHIITNFVVLLCMELSKTIHPFSIPA